MMYSYDKHTNYYNLPRLITTSTLCLLFHLSARRFAANAFD